MGIPSNMSSVQSVDLESLLSIKHTIQASQQHDHTLKKINRLHEKLQASRTENGLELSAKAAVKLLLAYETALKSCHSLQEFLHSTKEKIRVQEDLEIDLIAEIEEATNVEMIDVVDRNDMMVESDVGEVEINVVERSDFLSQPVQPMDIDAMEEDKAVCSIKVGSLVAVLCKVDEDSETDEWMIATIISSLAKEDSYVVEDCEMDEDGFTPQPTGQGHQRTIHHSKMIPLPSSSVIDEESVEGLKAKMAVLALYPGTTCLYPATVISTPSRRKKTRDYLLKFEDDEAPSRTCPPQFVIPMPK